MGDRLLPDNGYGICLGLAYCRKCSLPFGFFRKDGPLCRWESVCNGDCQCPRDQASGYSGLEVLSNPALLCEFLEARTQRQS
jgi:hypothetical protein